MKILLTGAAGFIGAHLAKGLLNRNYDVLGVDNLNDYYDPTLKIDRLKTLDSFNNFKFVKSDISDLENLENIFNEFKPQRVVNLAAQPGVRYSLKNPHAYVSSNLQGFVNVIDLCRLKNVEGLIYASSSSVYGDSKIKPFNLKDPANKPISLYGATKRSNEIIAYVYSHLYGLNTTGLRFFTVYGSWYRPDMAMHIFAEKISNDQPIDVYNNGKMKRDFTFIDDIINGAISSIEKNFSCEIFNLGNNKSENLMDLIGLIEKSFNKKALVNFKPIQPGDVLETYADIDYSKEKLNYEPKTSIDDGVPIFANWYKEYYNV